MMCPARPISDILLYERLIRRQRARARCSTCGICVICRVSSTTSDSRYAVAFVGAGDSMVVKIYRENGEKYGGEAGGSVVAVVVSASKRYIKNFTAA